MGPSAAAELGAHGDGLKTVTKQLLSRGTPALSASPENIIRPHAMIEEQVFFSVGTPHTSASRKRQHAQDALTSHRSSRARYSSAVLAIVRLQPVFLASRESGLGATARPSREL